MLNSGNYVGTTKCGLEVYVTTKGSSVNFHAAEFAEGEMVNVYGLHYHEGGLVFQSGEPVTFLSKRELAKLAS